jgi:hypothetical protein
MSMLLGLMLKKGDTRHTLVGLYDKLNNLWKVFDEWSLAPIGKGFFVFTFSSIKDLHRILIVGV